MFMRIKLILQDSKFLLLKNRYICLVFGPVMENMKSNETVEIISPLVSKIHRQIYVNPLKIHPFAPTS
jgi:hypothetical protein